MTGVSTLPVTVLTAAMAIGAGLIVGAYFLKMRRRRFEVPFAHLWQRVLDKVEARSIWQKLRRLLSLLLQLLLFGLLAGTAYMSTCGDKEESPSSTVYLIDASASMSTRESDGQTRLDIAKQAAQRLLLGKNETDAALIVPLDHLSAPTSRFSADLPGLLRAIDGISASGSRAQIVPALRTSVDVLRGRKGPRIVIIGDGQYHEELEKLIKDKSQSELVQELAKIPVHHITAGKTHPNVGITAFSIRKYPTDRLSFEGMVEIVNTDDKPVERNLEITIDDNIVETIPVAISPEVPSRVILKSLGGGNSNRVMATLTGGTDSFPQDDTAYALVPDTTRQRVLVVTPNNQFLTEGIQAFDDIVKRETMTPEKYDQLSPAQLENYDTFVFDDYTPKTVPLTGNLLYFHPTGEGSPFEIETTLTSPRITRVVKHPATRWLVLGDANFATSNTFKLDKAQGDRALALSVRSPVIVARSQGGRAIVATGFSIGETDLVLRVGFPLFLANVMEWFANESSEYLASVPTGQPRRINVEKGFGPVASLDGPKGKGLVPITDGYAQVTLHHPGFYRLRDEKKDIELGEFAANLASQRESTLDVPDAITLGAKKLTEPEVGQAKSTLVGWRYLALIALAILLLEWVSYHRRWTL